MSDFFSDDEKRAIASVVSAIAYADGSIATREMDYLGRIKFGLDIPDEMYEEGLAMEPTDSFAMISAMDPEKKERVGEILMRMAYADGELHPTEYQIVVGVALRCGIEFGG